MICAPRWATVRHILTLLGLSIVLSAGLLSHPLALGQSLRVEHHQPRPSPEVYESWVEQLFRGDEIWRVTNRRTLTQLLDEAKTTAALKQEILARYTPLLDDLQSQEATSHYVVDGRAGFVVIPPELSKRIPNRVHQRIQQYQFETLKLTPQHYWVEDSRDELQDFLRQSGANEADLLTLKKSIVHLSGRYYLIASPANWSAIPRPMREYLVDEAIHREVSRSTLTATLLIDTQTDLKKVAKKYAAGRDPAPIEAELRRALGNKPKTEMPLENLLPPAVREMLNTFSPCHGPNCFNSSLNVNKGQGFLIEHTHRDQLFESLAAKYRSVSPSESLEVGDLLVYFSKNGWLEHASSYVGNGIVFSKNGLSQFAPYVLQPMVENERDYFKSGNFKLLAFRTAPNRRDLPATSKLWIYRNGKKNIIEEDKEPYCPKGDIRLLQKLFDQPWLP